VKTLWLIHAPASHRETSLRAAREIFPDTQFAQEGETLIWPEKK